MVGCEMFIKPVTMLPDEILSPDGASAAENKKAENESAEAWQQVASAKNTVQALTAMR